MATKLNNAETTELAEIFSNINPQAHQTDPYYKRTHQIPPESEVRRCLCIELHMEFRKTMTEDAVQDSEEDQSNEILDKKSSSESEDGNRIPLAHPSVGNFI